MDQLITSVSFWAGGALTACLDSIYLTTLEQALFINFASTTADTLPYVRNDAKLLQGPVKAAIYFRLCIIETQ